MQVIARASEQDTLRQVMSSDRPELVAIYGPRRVGKTFTVSQTLQENPSALYFEVTGSVLDNGHPVSLSYFLSDFSHAWSFWMKEKRIMRSPEDCLEALIDLTAKASTERPLYVFLDELPWLARSSPRFFRGLSTLWNNALSKLPYMKLFVAGSATSWMIDHVIHSRTGLAKRVTEKLHMRSLDLVQTKQFLIAKGMHLTNDEILLIYSAIGGIPYYLDVLDPRFSPIENLYRLLVVKDGKLYAGTEYEELFRYLFSRNVAYRSVIDALVQKKFGFTHEELSLKLTGKEKPDGNLRAILENLERSELIERRMPFLNRSRGARLFVTDEYIRFVSHWLRSGEITTHSTFSGLFSSPSYLSWQGFDFELIAYKNYGLIMQALGLTGLSVEPSIYYKDKDVQIDLLLARADKTITICEAKSCAGPYEPTAEDVHKFKLRRQAIQDLLETKRKPHQYINCCFVVRNGIKRNRYFNEINPVVADISSVL